MPVNLSFSLVLLYVGRATKLGLFHVQELQYNTSGNHITAFNKIKKMAESEEAMNQLHLWRSISSVAQNSVCGVL